MDRLLVREGDVAEFLDVREEGNGRFRVSGYPFVTSAVALNDVVAVEPAPEQKAVTFKAVERDGGYSSFGVIAENCDPFEAVRILELQGAIVAQKGAMISVQVRHGDGVRFFEALSLWERQRLVSFTTLKRATAY